MRSNLLAFTLIVLMSSAAAASSGDSKPVVTHDVFPVVPATLEEMYAASDEVLEVQILSSTVKAVGDPTNPWARTFYVARILNNRKGTVRGNVIFTQAAGDVELADRILHASGQPLTIGDRYVVFLHANAYFGGRMLVGERSGAFKLRNGRVEPQGFGKLAEEQRDLPEQSFADELDRASRHRAKE